MILANVFVGFVPSVIDFVCPKCNGDPWHVPPSALYAIAFSVVFQTIVAYCAQAWALRYAPASLASLYATAQPIMAALVTCTFLLVGFNPSDLLHWPGRENIGAAFIIAGLLVAEYGSRQTLTKDRVELASSEEDDLSLEVESEFSQTSHTSMCRSCAGSSLGSFERVRWVVSVLV
mmetsp:Transcript_170688/g.542298  ORF Transcript_170688/g.542298 Transcript_170688/m.542298 type:complete len:176 (-) Transcript_170688:108-635(-)